MKTIYIIRHAKSSWSLGDVTDFERPLNERGNRDAPEMAKRMIDKNIQIDLFVSSTAKRAKQTCEHFCNVFFVNNNKIQFLDRLYHATPSTIQAVIESLDNRYNSVAIFTHNPGITDFVNDLIPDVRIDNMPTCAIFCAESDTSDWKTFSNGEKKMLFFDYPKSQ